MTEPSTASTAPAPHVALLTDAFGAEIIGVEESGRGGTT